MSGLIFNNNNQLLQFRTVTGDHTLTDYDNRKAIAFDSAIDGNITIDKRCAPGFYCYIVQKGNGKITLLADVDVTIISLGNKVQTEGPGDVIAVFSPEPNTFFLQINTASGGSGSGGASKKYRGADFADATKINDPWLVGKSVIVFYNDINRYLEDSEFDPTATGIEILLPGFDGPVSNPTLIVTELTAPFGGGGTE